jgi:maleylacetoacetate isomerase
MTSSANLRVRQDVERMAGEGASREWVRHWTDIGLAAVDDWLARYAGAYSVGDAVTMADFFVAPLVFNARRVGCDVPGYRNVARVVGNCLKLPAFERVR